MSDYGFNFKVPNKLGIRTGGGGGGGGGRGCGR